MDTLNNSVGSFIYTDDQMVEWRKEFLPRKEPFFLESKDIVHALLKQGCVVLTRQEFFAMFPGFNLQYGLVLKLWNIPQEGYVWISDAHERSLIDSEWLEQVFAEQVKLQRGQVDKNSSILTYDIWELLEPSQQEKWIVEWLQETLMQQPASQVARIRSEIPEIIQPIIDIYMDHFPTESGANCFAAALALASLKLDHAKSIINLWLHQGPFFRMLEVFAYEAIFSIHKLEQVDQVAPLDVLVWQDCNGESLHAAFCIAQGYVFNKMGQFWAQPWTAVALNDVFHYNDIVINGGEIMIYRR